MYGVYIMYMITYPKRRRVLEYETGGKLAD